MSKRFLTPRWIIGHLVVVAVVGAFIRLGIWQLDRLEARRAHNAIVAERMARQPVGLESLLGSTPAGELEYRPAVASGRFDVDEEILVRSRTLDGEAGFHVVTPLVTAPGVAVLVNRGWVPLDLDDPPVGSALPPAGPVQVIGSVRSSQAAPPLGPRDPVEGVLERVYWIDISRIQAQSAYSLLPVSIELSTQVPPQIGPLPVPVPVPELTEGPHLAYAIQWFSFALIGLSGYLVLLRRSGSTGGVGESAWKRQG